jgi:hypothetical protein
LLVLIVLVLAASRVNGSDLGQLARDLADRISALHIATGALRLETREDGSADAAELRELRQLVADELKKRHVQFSREPGAPTIRISFSEGLRGRLLIAQIQESESSDAIILPVPAGSPGSAPLQRVSLQKSFVWRQDEPILDFVLLPGKVLILSPTKVSLVENQENGWKEQYSWDLGTVEHLPRDPRGRLLLSDSEFTAYLPRHECRAAAEPGSRLQCEPSDRGWPIIPADPFDARLRIAAGRNYFDQLQTSNGSPPGWPPFYAAATIREQAGTGWAITTLAGNARIYDSRLVEIGQTRLWGPNLASAEVPECGNWLLAVIDSEGGKEALQAFQWVTDRPVAGSERLELEGVSTALWADGENRVRLVTRDLKSGRYAAWKVALVCAD